MARPPRLEFPGAVYHVLARGDEQRATFRDDVDRERYLGRLARYRDNFDFRLLEIRLMNWLIIQASERELKRRL